MTFDESGLQFKFSSKWIVRKYDEHAYFRGLSGSGLKGVDFIAIRNRKELIFIEVKNYRTRHNTKMNRSFDVVVKPVKELGEELKRKSEDTLLAMDAIMQYYNRSWWYRLTKKIWLNWPWLFANRAFWTQADFLLHQSLHYVIWLALDEDDPKNYEQELWKYLEHEKIEGVDRISVASGSQSPFEGEVMVLY